jgi:DNA modification methylase
MWAERQTYENIKQFCIVRTSDYNFETDLNELPVSSFWSNGSKNELKMHKIHAYPAKFRAFLVSKSLEYARNEGIKVKLIADIFCGCGTTALEAKQFNKDFWGCDINPVATLIAKVKSEQHNQSILEKYFKKILGEYSTKTIRAPDNYILNDRLSYWFSASHINDLYKLLNLIGVIVPKGKYQNFFLCAFSNILKGTSRWLTKSIKPQIDPFKIPQDVKNAFEQQFHFMSKANEETIKTYTSKSKVRIVTKNFLKINIDNPFIDLLITSPPYVTSYEYADLYQLSTLWLGCTNDYRGLREGTIGSLYFLNDNDVKVGVSSLNYIGQGIYHRMHEVDKRKAKTIAKYFLDIKKSIDKAYSFLNPGALAVIIIGNTKYKDIEVNNAKFIANCMIETGFSRLEIFKRKIGPKILTPYRDSKGRFSKNANHRKVYSHEFVIIGKK